MEERFQSSPPLYALDSLPADAAGIQHGLDVLGSLAMDLFGVHCSGICCASEKRLLAACQGASLSAAEIQALANAHYAHGHDVLVVADAAADPQFATLPLFQPPSPFHFYAGAAHPPDAQTPATLFFLIDPLPRQLNTAQAGQLQRLAEAAAAIARIDQIIVDRQAHSERFQLILDNALDAFIAIDTDSRVIEWSRQAEATFGWRREEAVDQLLTGLIIPPQYREAHLNGMRRYLATGENRFLNRRVAITALHKDGREFPIELAITQIRQGAQPLFSASLRDLTAHVATEQALKRQTDILQSILDSIPEAVTVADVNRQLILANPAAEQLLGIQPQAHEGEAAVRHYELLHPLEDQPLPAEQRPILRALRGEAVNNLEVCIRHPGQAKQLWLSANARPIRGESGQIQGAVAVFRDVTAQKHVEARLREAEETFRMLMESVEDFAIIMMDRNGIITGWNSGAEHIIGYREEEALGQSIALIYPPEDVARQVPQRELERALRDGRSIDDRWLSRPDGSRFYTTGVVSPLYDEQDRLRGYARIMRDATARRLTEEKTIYLANHDVLTGLANRVYFSNRLHEILAQSRRGHFMTALLMLDLDRFKSVNDTFGHHIGDLLLKEVASRLQACVRETDLVARLGGDEFVIIQTNLAAPADAAVLAEKIIGLLGQPFVIDHHEVLTGTSIGITLYPVDAQDAGQLMKNADLAMYQVKTHGRHNYHFYTEQLHIQAHARQAREQALRHALAHQELSLHFQPQIDLASWQLYGVEALLRTQHPVLAPLPPTELVALAEEMGVMPEIDSWVLKQACLQAAAWRQLGIPPFRMAVNLSLQQGAGNGLTERVQQALAASGLPANCLTLEIGERTVMEGAISEMLAPLQEMGVRIAIDDFGAGLSSLNFLKRFAADILKIDQSIIRNVPHRLEDTAIASSIIHLAQQLQIRVMAAGAETAEQLAWLVEAGCSGAQGFLFAPPLPADELTQLLLDGQWLRMNPV